MPSFTIHPLQKRSRFAMDEYVTWGASVVRAADGTCHMYVAMWPRRAGTRGWVTHSVIAHATASDPLGTFAFDRIVLGPQQRDVWDRDCAHNPTVMQHEGKYYLYYMGNAGNGEYWDNRNRQRIGVAVAGDPAGPFVRRDEPLLGPGESGSWDDMITMNPSVTRTPDGRFLMIYKAASRRGDPPRYGPVYHGAAFADSPAGPFRKHPDPIFVKEGVDFAGEDPFVWCQDGTYYVILKDMGKHYTDQERALVLFTSPDGIDWNLAETPVVTGRHLVQEDGSTFEFHRIERPQLYFENGRPAVLYVGANPVEGTWDSSNIHLGVTFS